MNAPKTKEVSDVVRKLMRDGEVPLLPEYPDDARITEFADIAVDLSVTDYVIKALIHRGDVGVIFGASGSGKTFLTLDLSLHAAAGKPWNGHRVHKAFVLYVASENPRSVTRRVVAWREQHKPDGRVAFALMGGAIDLRDSVCVDQISQAVKAGQARYGVDAALVVIDTLARAAPGADENASDDMSKIVGAADRIRTATGAAVALVHHAGKDDGRGARGHSSLKGACDFEMEVKDKVATITKSRDTEIGLGYAFKLDPVELGVDTDGDPVTTCVVSSLGTATAMRKPKRVPTPGVLAFKVLRELISERGETMPGTSEIPAGVKAVRLETWRDRFTTASKPATVGQDDKTADSTVRQRWKRAIDALQNAEIVGSGGAFAWVADTTVTP